MGILHQVAPLALLFAMPTGCADRSVQEQQQGKAPQQETKDAEDIYAPDIRDGWQWSAAEIAALTKRAESGDMKAADRLFQYYSVHEDEAKVAYWEDWLFKRGHPGAIELRVHHLYTTSRKRADGDPRKLAELREAERLWLSASPENGASPFLDTIRSEIASVEKSR